MKRLLPWLALAFVVSSCGGKGAKSPEAAAGKVDLDADPLALLPSAAIVVATVDAHALFDAPAIGPQVVALTDKLVPLGSDAGFEAKRDVDRVLLGSYAQTGADVAAIVTGRFDETKLAAATKSKSGAPITKTLYAGTATYAVGQGIYAVLTSKTIVAGSSDGVRRVLDRIHDAHGAALTRAMPAWVVDTLQTPGAQVAAAGDFETQPVVAAAIGPVKIPWIEGIQKVRALGDFHEPGLHVAATLTYGTEAQASAGAEGVRTMSSMLKVVGPLLGGVSVQDLDVKTKAADLECKFTVDDKTLSHLIELAPRVIPGAQ